MDKITLNCERVIRERVDGQEGIREVARFWLYYKWPADWKEFVQLHFDLHTRNIHYIIFIWSLEKGHSGCMLFISVTNVSGVFTTVTVTNLLII